MKLLQFGILFVFFRAAECACTYPSHLRGDWYSSSNGLLTVSDSAVANLVIAATQTGAHAYTCEIAGQDNRYVTKATVSFFSSSTSNIWLCMQLQYLSPAKYLLSYDTEKSSTFGTRLVAASTSSSFVGTYDSVCTDTNESGKGTHDILVNKDNLAAARQDCPGMLQGDFTVYNEGDHCAETLLHVAPKSSSITFSNSSSCSSPFSDSGIYDCIYSLKNDQYTYVNILNNDTSTDEINNFRFSCLVLEKRVNILYLSERPQICTVDQTSVYVASPGRKIVLFKKDHTVSNAGQIAAGVIMGFICLCVQVFALGSCISWFVKSKSLGKVEASSVKYV